MMRDRIKKVKLHFIFFIQILLDVWLREKIIYNKGETTKKDRNPLIFNSDPYKGLK